MKNYKLVDIVIKAVTSKTVWGAIASAIMLAIYMKTGVVEQIQFEDEMIARGVELTTGFLAALGYILTILFRVFSKDAKEKEELLDVFHQNIENLDERGVEILKKYAKNGAKDA